MKRRPIQGSFGERVRELRECRGLTQKQLAKGAKISQPSLSDIELGETSPQDIKADTLAGLVMMLETNPQFLRTGRDSPVQPKILSIEEAEVIDIYRRLEPRLQSALLSHCRTMFDIQKTSKPSRAKPFVRST